MQRVLTLADPLLRRVSAVVELADPLGGSVQVGDDEADPRVQFDLVPLNPSRHYAPSF
jgi:hypothetical protein